MEDLLGTSKQDLNFGQRICEAEHKKMRWVLGSGQGKEARRKLVAPSDQSPALVLQCAPPTFAIMFHIGRNTPNARMSTMPPTNTISTGSIIALRFLSV